MNRSTASRAISRPIVAGCAGSTSVVGNDEQARDGMIATKVRDGVSSNRLSSFRRIVSGAVGVWKRGGDGGEAAGHRSRDRAVVRPWPLGSPHRPWVALSRVPGGPDGFTY